MQIPPPEIIHFGLMQGMVQVLEVSCDPGEIWVLCRLGNPWKVWKMSNLM